MAAPAAATTARSCPLVAASHDSGGGEGGGGAHGPTCTNTGPVYLNNTHAEERHCRRPGCQNAGNLQRWLVQLPPWAPPGAALPGRLLTIQVRGLRAWPRGASPE